MTFHEVIDEFVKPYSKGAASEWDTKGEIPESVFQELSSHGLWGVCISEEYGGHNWTAEAYGQLFSALGSLSMSLVSAVTVHNMFLHSLKMWGNDLQKEQWLQPAVRGDLLGAFALTEPETGSDAKNVALEIKRDGNELVINGKKKWISLACRADIFIVFGSIEGEGTTAIIIPKNTKNLKVEAMKGLLGFRAAGLGEMTFDQCRISSDNLLGRPGGGISHIAGSALDLGRFIVAHACLGCMEVCTAESVYYAKNRKQFDSPLMSHQLIKAMLSEMITSVRATRQLCRHAAELREAGHPDSIVETTVAKYFASVHVGQVASKAVQIHGANGCSAQSSEVERHFRDARICEIIEGSTQMQQLMIANSGAGEFLRMAKKKRK